MSFFIILIFLVIAIYFLATYFMFVLVCKKTKKDILPMSKNMYEILKTYKKKIDKGNEWVEEKIRNNQAKEVFIKSNDNIQLHGLLIDHIDSKGVIIEAHGYRSTAKNDLYASCFEYYNIGYSLLIVDNRTSNKSEGKYITFGIKESEDVLCWVKYINNNFSNANICLAGISMGASSVLMAVRDVKDNMNIKCVIADSGYISACDEIVYCIKHYFHLNGNFFIDMINLWCILFAKFNLKEKITTECIKDSKLPILFIHGKTDDFVLPSNSLKNYESYKGPKGIALFEDAKHGMGYLTDSDRYVDVIKTFLEKLQV